MTLASSPRWRAPHEGPPHDYTLMTTLPDKTAVHAAVLAAIKTRLSQTQDNLRRTHAAATHEESRADNKYDTRSLEMSYLATGMTDRVAELRRVLSAYHFWSLPPQADVVRPGALVVLIDDEDARMCCYIAPYGSADTVQVDGVQIRVITLKAPLGRALVGKGEGDEVTVKVDGVARIWEIEQLR